MRYDQNPTEKKIDAKYVLSKLHKKLFLIYR